MSARRFSLEEVERAFDAAADGGRPRWDWVAARLNALPEEPDLLGEAVELLQGVRWMHNAKCQCTQCLDLGLFLAKVETPAV